MKLIEMTDWELQDFAAQVVRQQLEKQGRQLMSWQGNPSVDPSLWLSATRDQVVARPVRYPRARAAMGQHRGQLRLGKTGHFASVVVANADDPFDATGTHAAIPLWRGHPLLASFGGLVRNRL